MVRIRQSIVGATKGYQGHRIKMSHRKFSKSYFGSNYRKAERNYRNGVAIEKLRFQRNYPSADISKFMFDAVSQFDAKVNNLREQKGWVHE